NEPDCPHCPLATVCAANRLNIQHEIPATKPRPTITELREAAVVVRRNGSVLVRQCGEGERCAGLWDFPRVALEGEGPLFAQDEIVAKVASQTGVTCRPGAVLKTIKHGVTRYRITLDCYAALYSAGRVRSNDGTHVRWLPIDELASLPLSTTG